MYSATLDSNGSLRLLTFQGDALTNLVRLDADSVDALVTDPPANIGFMEKEWDSYAQSKDDPIFGNWLAGFTDGEGCFRIHKAKQGEYFACHFSLKLRRDDKTILDRICAFMGVGRVVDIDVSDAELESRPHTSPQALYIVDSREGCARVKEIFQTFPLRAKKARDFAMWCEALDAWNRQGRGNRWHGPADKSEMESFWLKMKDLRDYSDVPVPAPEARGGSGNGFIDSLTAIFKEAFRILKPGAYGLVWALPRTSHWTATALEDAGFEIRDVITHLFGQGMPKGMNISKALDKEVGVEGTLGAPKSPMHEAWMKRGYVMSEGSNDGYTRDWMKDPAAIDKNAREYIPGSDIARKWLGWSTTLAPRSENWILVRKPLIGTVAENVMEHGVGGLNIDASRIEYQNEADKASATPQGKCTSKDSSSIGATPDAGRDVERVEFQRPEQKGRWPGNAILDEEAAAMLDAQSGIRTSGKPGVRRKAHETTSMSGRLGLDGKQETGYGDTGGASRFFYCSKAPKADKGQGNDHPTVKHTSLMDYLIRLIAPPGGIILDPFMGSGTTGVAALRGGWSFIGIEADEHYYSIATKRLKESE